MAMQFYASPEQIMRDRSELARKGIARGRSAVVLSYAGGVLFVAENLSSALHKVSEIYDRIGFAAVGRYNEFENLRRAGVRMADLNGLSYDRRDVTGLALANAFAQTLGAIFTEQSKPFEVEICVAEVGATPDDDSLYRNTYDGSVTDEPGRMAMGGQADAIAGVLKSNHRPDMSLGEAVKVAVQALGSVGGEGGAARSIAANQLEVAVLDRNRVGRTFRRITGAALIALLDGGAEGEAADGDRAKTPTTPTEEAHKPTTSAGSADLEDKPGNPEA
ncbi:proteasome subunit alpha [Micromonospora zingiberis]|uniref:Proteasome subunit alpha n=1 Tax=Micromonospora zingiberis TaxID=2053011 RepID=A0A4R0GSE8_9ACTN|nr:proteasome subunit alpha [Micromonospora zingiberis]TCC00627.1 proteasome subunit alpha [Micromonospora zingiberis]